MIDIEQLQIGVNKLALQLSNHFLEGLRAAHTNNSKSLYTLRDPEGLISDEYAWLLYTFYPIAPRLVLPKEQDIWLHEHLVDILSHVALRSPLPLEATLDTLEDRLKKGGWGWVIGEAQARCGKRGVEIIDECELLSARCSKLAQEYLHVKRNTSNREKVIEALQKEKELRENWIIEEKALLAQGEEVKSSLLTSVERIYDVFSKHLKEFDAQNQSETPRGVNRSATEGQHTTSTPHAALENTDPREEIAISSAMSPPPITPTIFRTTAEQSIENKRHPPSP